MIRAATTFLLVLLSTPFVLAQEPDTTEDAPEKQAALTLPLPSRDATGRPVWPIGVYQSQLVDVIPDHFRAVAVDELRNALQAGSLGVSRPNECRVASAFYEIRLENGVLESNRTELLIAHRGPGTKDVRLGEVNLAIHRGPEGGIAGRVPRLEVDESGVLHAVVSSAEESQPEEDDLEEASELPGNEESVTKVSFAWSLSGTTVDDATTFVLQIPRASQTRMVFSTPKNVRLRSRHGVLIERPSPPPDADLQSRTQESRWYVLEAGGLERIELSAVRDSGEGENAPILVRRESRQYEIDLSGITWTHRLSLESARVPETIRLRCEAGTVASVRIDSFRVQPSVIEVSDQGTILEIAMPNLKERPVSRDENGPSDAERGRIAPTVLTVTGNASWELPSGTCDLPAVEFESPSVIRTEPETQAVVTILDSIRVDDWLLPSGWVQSVEAPGKEQTTLLLAQGPPSTLEAGVWSRLRLSPHQPLSIDPTLLRLDVEQAPSPLVRGVARLRVRGLTPIVPVHFQVEPGWTVTDVTVLGSGRKILFDSGRELGVWPEPDDLVDGLLTVEVVGQRNLRASGQTLTLPSAWFVRPKDRVTPQVTAIQPPKRRRWDANSILLADRVSSQELSQEARDFLRADSDTLLVRRMRDGSVGASLEPTKVSYDVSLRHALESNNGRVLETIVVRTDTSSSLSTLTIQTGRIDDVRSPFRWSLRSLDGSGVLSIPESQVSVSSDAETQTYAVALDDRDLDDYELFGRRLYDPAERLRIVLPSVRGATTQNAETQLSSDWNVVELPTSVQLVPVSAPLGDRDGQRLRYDSTDWQAITIEPTSGRKKASLIWSQTLNVLTSSRGQDVFQLSALISTQTPIVIAFEPDLELISVRRNGLSIPFKSARQNRIRVEPEQQTDQIAVTLVRRHNSTSWLRTCEIPDVSLDGHVLSHQETYSATPESMLLPMALAKLISPDAPLMTVPRNVCLALGWLLAGAGFVVSWIAARLSRWGMRAIMLGTILAVGASIIWWPYQQAIIAWIALPLGLAGLVHASATWSQVRTSGDAPDNSRRDQSADFSFSRLAWVPLIFGAFSAQTALAQVNEGNIEGVADATAPINLMVPLTDNHEFVGDKVYVADEDYQTIIARSDPSRPIAARIQHAEYRIFLTLDRESENDISSTVEADYDVLLEGNATNLRLPVKAEFVRRVELINDNQRRIIRHTVNPTGTINVAVPPGRFFRLRVSFQPQVRTTSEQPSNDALPGSDDAIDELAMLTRPLSIVGLEIPRVHSARVIVEAPRQISVISLGKTLGRAVKDPDVARYSADLGPVRRLSITCQRSGRPGVETTQAGRRSYRVSVGLGQLFVECEVVPARQLSDGESTELLVIGATPSSLLCSGWAMEQVTSVSQQSETTADASRVSSTYRFTKQGDVDTPIRLAWTLPLAIESSEAAGDVSLPIPEVIAGTLDRSFETLFGFEMDQRLELSDSTTALVADERLFLDAWQGYRGTIEQCYRGDGDFPSFAVSMRQASRPTIKIQQSLYVAMSKMRLRFSAELTDSDPSVRRLTLVVPKGFRILRCAVNESDLSHPGTFRDGEVIHLPLGDRRVEGQMSVEVEAEISRRGWKSTALPRFGVNMAGEIDETYVVSHDRNTLVELTSQESIPSWESVASDEASLLEGSVPFAMTRVPSIDGENQTDQLKYSTRAGGSRFRCSQFSTMAYSAGRWSCRTSVEIPRKQCPPFIDLAIPSRWAADMEITGAAESVTRVSPDQSVTVVRIALPRGDGTPSASDPVRCEVLGFLDKADQIRVSVPSVEVLGDGIRKRLVAVPNRLTAEPIRWRSGGGARSLSEQDQRDLVLNAESELSSHTVYKVEGTSWAIDLEPLAPATEEPIATIGDARIILEADKALVFQRYDLAPETLNGVTVVIPPQAELVGIWSAGREVELSVVDEGEHQIPLAYSRLGQSLEILVSVSVGAKAVDGYLPTLRDVPVSKQWIAFYSALSEPYATRANVVDSREDFDQEIDKRASRWRLELAESIVAVIDRSRDTLADRGSDEVNRWLLPWLSRYRQLAVMSGADFKSGEMVVESTLNNASSWRSLHGALMNSIGGQLEPESADVETLFDEDRFSGYDLEGVLELVDEDSLPPIKLTYPMASPVRGYLRDGLTLLMIGLVFILTWPFRGQLANLLVHPMVWICLVAIPMAFLIPSSIAVGTVFVVLVPITLARLGSFWYARSHRSSRSPTR